MKSGLSDLAVLASIFFAASLSLPPTRHLDAVRVVTLGALVMFADAALRSSSTDAGLVLSACAARRAMGSKCHRVSEVSACQ